MVRYFYAWTPLVIAGTVVLQSLPWLGLIALMIFSLVALAALAGVAWAIVFVPYTLGRTISRRWREQSGAHQPSAALALAEHRGLTRPVTGAFAVTLFGSRRERRALKADTAGTSASSVARTKGS